MMIEPTESECKEDLDRLVIAVERIAREAATQPDLLHEAPSLTKVGRLDEVTAARHPCLTG
jgi:glycine dehydrogenase subunit 2